ncbi:MAG: transposase, partial [Tannerella sp.]|nr:transposase [Tannerella sp.]
SGEKWTNSQRKRAKILFEQYPDIEKAYSLSHSLRMIFNKRSINDSARLNMARWYNKAEEAGFHSFNVIAATFYEHSEEILNFYTNRSSNASAESFNSKIKSCRAELREFLIYLFFFSAYQSSMPKHRVLQVSRDTLLQKYGCLLSGNISDNNLQTGKLS